MSKAKRKEIANADLLKVVKDHRTQILSYYNQVADKRPVILLDLQRRKLRAYPFERYQKMLRQGSRPKFDAEYQKALAKDKVLVLVWDSVTRRLVTITLRRG
jgi:hypothetical protein